MNVVYHLNQKNNDILKSDLATGFKMICIDIKFNSGFGLHRSGIFISLPSHLILTF